MAGNRAEIIRALVSRWNSGERAASEFAEWCDPGIELQSPLSSVAGEPYRGYEGLERWLCDLDEQFAQWMIQLDEVREVGDRVITIATITALGRASGVSLRFSSATVCGFGSDERITRVRIYSDVEEGLGAVGLAG